MYLFGYKGTNLSPSNWRGVFVRRSPCLPLPNAYSFPVRWGASQPAEVTLVRGGSTNHYWSVVKPLLVTTTNHYWFAREALLVRPRTNSGLYHLPIIDSLLRYRVAWQRNVAMRPKSHRHTSHTLAYTLKIHALIHYSFLRMGVVLEAPDASCRSCYHHR